MDARMSSRPRQDLVRGDSRSVCPCSLDKTRQVERVHANERELRLWRLVGWHPCFVGGRPRNRPAQEFFDAIAIRTRLAHPGKRKRQLPGTGDERNDEYSSGDSTPRYRPTAATEIDPDAHHPAANDPLQQIGAHVRNGQLPQGSPQTVVTIHGRPSLACAVAVTSPASVEPVN